MLEKLFRTKLKKATCSLKTINLTTENVNICTPYHSFSNVCRKFNPKAPSCSSMLKAMKNESISIDILIKNSALVHFFIKNEEF